MKIELNQNKVFYNNGSEKKEIHPFWLRERVNGGEYLDKGTQQRLFDPTSLSSNISINKANINEKYLEIDFNDGVTSKLEIDKIALEFSKNDIAICPENTAAISVGSSPIHLTDFYLNKNDLQIKGHSLMMGYLNQELNKSSFKKDGFFFYF